MAHRVTWLDVFTSTPLVGNGLAVVHDADDIDEDTMLAIARETRLSETTFVQAPTLDGADYRNRIYTLMSEIDFAGHPSLGTAVAVARARDQTHASYVQQTRAGLQPVEVELSGTLAKASMIQGPASFGPQVDAAAALATLSLSAGDAHPELAPQAVTTGEQHLLVPLRDADALARAHADADRLIALTRATRTTVVYAFVFDERAGTATARGFFENPLAVVEDPATGSAAGPLCAYLHRNAGLDSVTVAQGGQMGRPSRLDTAMEGDHVRVSGDVVVVIEGTLLL